MSSKAFKVLQAIMDKDLHLTKSLIPTKREYDDVINGKPLSPEELTKAGFKSEITVTKAQNEDEKILMEAAFSVGDIDLLRHLSSMGALSQPVAFSFLKSYSGSKQDNAVEFILNEFTFPAHQLIEALGIYLNREGWSNVMADMLKGKVDGAIFSMVRDIKEDDINGNRSSYEQLISTVSQWKISDRRAALITDLLRKYPGEMTNKLLLRRLDLPALDLSFERIMTLTPHCDALSFVSNERDRRHLKPCPQQKSGRKL
mgnify:CR=1 FL=1